MHRGGSVAAVGPRSDIRRTNDHTLSVIPGFKFIQGLPRNAIVPGTDVVDGSGKRIRVSRRVLVLDNPTHWLMRRMRARGIEPTVTANVDEAALALAARDFDGVVTEIDRGLRLVKWLKASVDDLEVGASVTEQARHRHVLTPVFVFLDGAPEWAVIVRPPEHAYLEDGKGVQLVDAIACLDVARLLLRGPALA